MSDSIIPARLSETPLSYIDLQIITEVMTATSQMTDEEKEVFHNEVLKLVCNERKRLFTIYYPAIKPWLVAGHSIEHVSEVAFGFIESMNPCAKIKYMTVVEELA